MDRVLKVFSRPNCLFAELSFFYDRPDSVSALLTTYRAIEFENDGEFSYSVYPGLNQELYPSFRRFSSVAEARAHDWELVRQRAAHEFEAGLTYTYGYDEDPVLLRYVLEDHRGCQAMIDFRYSFAANTKTMVYRSTQHPRFDHELVATGLDSNADCMQRVPLFHMGEPTSINFNDLRRLEPWY
ncbi:hypothetical protein EPD60_13735 [Flaviaesturariibacter flavus]|uniref:Uncharacterized protein n=1 Tax=Flaviaesturariibacter flavus TaxID=2502780 RepID=A0A4V2NVE2_9BACT|nr:hypothetical protein [Flaviaesturariibacter flavus]TCJ13126.1 hypothetical protein EPD60_13735 [Flaviaesturariibacter flavus]